MSSISKRTFAPPGEERLVRKRESGRTGPRTAPGDMVGMLRHLQRAVGNRAVNALLRETAARQHPLGGIQRSALVQRDDDTDDDNQNASQDTDNQNASQDSASQQDMSSQQDQDDGGLQAASGEQAISLPAPDPVTLSIDGGYGPGDYETPSDQSTMMAKHLGVPIIQRDDTPPQGSGSGGSDGGGQPDNNASVQSTTTLKGPQQAAYQMQVTRTIHLLPPLSLDKLHIDFFQDPQISIGVDAQGTLSTQVAQNLFTVHFLRNWKTPVDLGLSAVWQQNILPKLQSQQGGQLQAEQHVTKTFSVTFTMQGMRTDSDDGKSRVWSVTAAGGVITYF
jgi:hypothetical protein